MDKATHVQNEIVYENVTYSRSIDLFHLLQSVHYLYLPLPPFCNSI